MNDDDIRALVTRAGHAPSDTFRTHLRRELDEQAQGGRLPMHLREVTAVKESNRTWQIAAAAASIVALVAVGALVLGRDNSDVDDLIVTDTAITDTTPTDTTVTSNEIELTTTAPTPDETSPATTLDAVAITPQATAPETVPANPPDTSSTESSEPARGGNGRTLVTDQVDIVTGTAFGFSIGEQTSPDDVIPTVTAVLGAPTHDTGWFTVPYKEAYCLSSIPHRVVWWGSYSMSFFDNADNGVYLWTWSIGDRSASLQDRDGTEPYTPPADASSPLATSDGITVGSPAADVVAQYGDRFDDTTMSDGQRLFTFSNGRYTISFQIEDDIVTGIASALTFC